MEKFWNIIWPNPKKVRGAVVFLALMAFLYFELFGGFKSILAEPAQPAGPMDPADRLIYESPALPAHAERSGFQKPEISGTVKTLNFFTRTTGFNPDTADRPQSASERGESVFNSMERFRLKARIPYETENGDRVEAKVHYDHQVHFGSYTESGDFRLARKLSEDRQFLDLTQTLVDKPGTYYFHRLYRATVLYRHKSVSVETGRQQIPWGVGHFFTPTDVFNPFNPTQIELEERDGVDGVNFKAGPYKGTNAQFVYTPRGRRLHPQRFMGRVSRDVKGYEVGILGGGVASDPAVGMDIQGNIFDAAVRGEALYRDGDEGKDFLKFTLNADYNFPHNVLGLLEYHYNGEGERHSRDYHLDRFLRGDVSQLARNYLGLMVSHDLTSLWKITGRAIMNLDDVSFYVRPELQYEAMTNLFLVAGAQLFTGQDHDEFDRGENLYFGEARYSF